MDKITAYQYWAALIAKEQLGAIGASEAAELAEWVSADSQHRQLYERLKLRDYAGDILTYRKIDTEAGLKVYYGRYPHRKDHRIYRWTAVAAVVFMLLGIGLLAFYKQKTVEKEVAEISPGMAKAELILGDGSVRQLEQEEKGEIRLSGMVVRNTGTAVEYASGTPSGRPDTLTEFNELRIPVGGEYQLVMADGTKVWLNSQTRLRFPVNFRGRQREVYLSGEAYFEVARDVTRPFRVCTKEGIRIQVSGTSFNVRAYDDEETVETVLEKGSVSMCGPVEDKVLEPGTRAVYDQKSGKMSLKQVDTELYTAWRVGSYIFHEETVGMILHKLSRWYGMNVFFSNEQVKDVIFSGSIRKYDTIKKLLEAMEISGGVRFQLNGNTIIVYSGH